MLISTVKGSSDWVIKNSKWLLNRIWLPSSLTKSKLFMPSWTLSSCLKDRTDITLLLSTFRRIGEGTKRTLRMRNSSSWWPKLQLFRKGSDYTSSRNQHKRKLPIYTGSTWLYGGKWWMNLKRGGLKSRVRNVLRSTLTRSVSPSSRGSLWRNLCRKRILRYRVYSLSKILM